MKSLADEILDYLETPRTPEAVRVFAVQRRKASSGEVATALDVLSIRGDIELFLDCGVARLRRSGVNASVVRLLEPHSPEDAAAKQALALLRAIQAKHDEIGAVANRMTAEKRRIQPEIDRISAKLAEMKDQKRELEGELEHLTDERDGIARALTEELKEGNLFAESEGQIEPAKSARN